MEGRRRNQDLTLRVAAIVGVLGLGLVAWWVTHQDALLGVLLGLLQVLFAAPLVASEPALDDARAEQLRSRLHAWQRQAWRHLVMSRHLQAFLSDDGRAPESLVPPRVGAWPADLGVLQPGLLTRSQVEKAARQLIGGWSRVVVTGAEDVGKTVFQLLLLLQTQRLRDTVPSAKALPLLLPMAQWPLDADGVPVRMSLRAWAALRLREDYPNLYLSGRQVDALVDWLWECDPDGAPRRVLFLDGIDELAIDEEQRAELLQDLLTEDGCGAGSVVVACRTGTWSAVRALGLGDGWSTIGLDVPADDDVRQFVTSKPWQEYLLSQPAVAQTGAPAHPIRSSLRLLQLVADLYCGSSARCTTPAWLSGPHALVTPDDVRRVFWQDILDQVRWPAGDQTATSRARGTGTTDPAAQDAHDFTATVAWLNRHHAFAGSGSAWWDVPRLAAADPDLGPVVGRARRLRLLSVLHWTAGAWTVGLGLIWLTMVLGWVTGYPRADGGLVADGGLSGVDIRQGWLWGGLPVVVANPFYDALAAGAVVLAAVTYLSWFGGELEHPAGGRPRPLRFGFPTVTRVRRLRLPRRTGVLLVAGPIVAGVAVTTGAPSVAGIVALPWAVVAAMGWVLASVRATAEGVDASDLFTRDRRVTRVVAGTVASAGAGVSVVSHWAVTAGAGGWPSATGMVWTVAAVALFVGVGRGLRLGAAMGLTTVVPLRPGVGFGYGARLRLVERAAQDRIHAADGAPFRPRWVELFELEERPSGAGDAHPAAAGTGSPRNVPMEAVVPAIGSRLLLRDASMTPSLAQFLPVLPHAAAAPGHGGLPGGGLPGDRSVSPADSVRSRAARLANRALVMGVAVCLLAVAGGVTPAVLPRVFCTHVTSPLRAGAVASNLWWENGQCVGFLVPGLERWPAARLTTVDPLGRSQEARVNQALHRIEVANRRALRPNGVPPLTVVFFAPLTRQPRRNDRLHAINALWQLEGVAQALEEVNRGRGVRVRLVVANSGDNFVSGTAVARALDAAFPTRAGAPGIDAVIGIAQSRQSARAALALLDPRTPIVAASVFGTRMKDGLTTQPPTLPLFTSMAPSDATVAGPMVTQALSIAEQLAASQQLPEQPRQPRQPRVGIIYDDLDPYFSADLEAHLEAQLAQRKVTCQGDVPWPESTDAALPAGSQTDSTCTVYTLPELRPDHSRWTPQSQVAELARVLCGQEDSQESSQDDTGDDARAKPPRVWLYAGRGNRWTALDAAIGAMNAQRKVTGRPSCQPHVVGGPGLTSAVASNEWPEGRLVASQGLTFLSLAQPPISSKPPVTAHATAAYTDQQLGRAALLGVPGLLDGSSPSGPSLCPATPTALGIAIDRSGHNTLGSSTNPCARAEGSEISFCSFARPAECSSPTPRQQPVPTRPQTLQATVNRPPRNSSSGASVFADPRRTDQANLVDVLPWESKVTVICQVPHRTTDREQAWVGVSKAGGGVGFLRWRFRGLDENVYLRFPALGGALATGRWSAPSLPSDLPQCQDRDALVRLVDRR